MQTRSTYSVGLPLPQEMVDLERGTATRLPRATSAHRAGEEAHGMISNKHDYLSLSDRLVMSDSMRVRDSGLTSAGLRAYAAAKS